MVLREADPAKLSRRIEALFRLLADADTAPEPDADSRSVPGACDDDSAG
ncbi:hypothetical protein [Streptomyces sp. AK02-01A]|nr:hypothetical protein [Streptomyces sp. AK02-01A]MDX3852385.1 hypothetical protein [Streptomyces sp. AK02-01A]